MEVVVCWKTHGTWHWKQGSDFSDFHVMANTKYLRWKLKFSFQLQGPLLIFIGSSNSSGPVRIWPLNAHTQLLPHPGLVTQFQEYSFPMNHSSVPYTSLSVLLLFGIMTVLQPFNHQPLLRHPNVWAVSNPGGFRAQLSEQGAVFSTRCCGTPVQRHHGWLPNPNCMGGCSPPPSMPAWLKSSSDRTQL